MRTSLIVGLIAAACAVTGCNKSSKSGPGPSGENAEASIKQVTIPEVAGFVKTKSAVIVDANGADTRKEYGVIPGAVLLSDHDKYPISELPADKTKKLVFYCGGVMCRASDAAAARASSAGYKDVNILRDGIKGWKSAGQPTDVARS